MPVNLKEIQEFCRDELTDLEFYRGLSEKVKDDYLKKNLLRLSEVEKQHSQFWISYLQKNGVDTSRLRPKRLKIRFMLFIFRILGIGLSVNLLEYGEVETVAKYRDYAKRAGEDKEFKEGIERIIKEEIEHEDVFSYTLEQNKEKLDRNRDIIYGISDGLVEVLASIAGLTALLTNHLDVALGGLVVGVSGTMSMSVGAYLAKDSESQYKISGLRRLAILRNQSHDTKKVGQYKGESRRSAFNVGMFYILGAAIPILPFLFLPRDFALVISIILVAVTQGLANSIIAISMNMRILKEAVKASGLALLAALASYLVAQVFHMILHVSLI
jgi:predicted membrane protein (TIGR00267 family)